MWILDLNFFKPNYEQKIRIWELLTWYGSDFQNYNLDLGPNRKISGSGKNTRIRNSVHLSLSPRTNLGENLKANPAFEILISNCVQCYVIYPQISTYLFIDVIRGVSIFLEYFWIQKVPHFSKTRFLDVSEENKISKIYGEKKKKNWFFSWNSEFNHKTIENIHFSHSKFQIQKWHFSRLSTF